MLKIEELQKIWFEKEKKKIENGKHKYLHIDQRLMTLDKNFVKDIWVPGKIVRHPFYPFALFYEKRYKYVEDPITKKRYKSDKKPRPISYATHYDSLIYSWYAYLLSYHYEPLLADAGISKNVIAYRPSLEKKGSIEFAKEVIDFIKKDPNCVVLNFDVEDFFGTIDHTILKKAWVDLMKKGNQLEEDHYAVFRAVTHFSQFDLLKISKILDIDPGEQKSMLRLCSPKQFREIIMANPDGLFISKRDRTAGIPQGAAISCVLSNLYMLEFDLAVAETINRYGGLYRRYSDDIVIVLPTVLAKEGEKLICDELQKIRLKISPEKKEQHTIKIEGDQIVCHDESGNKSNLQYLGIEFNGKDVYVRHKGLAKFQTRLSRGVRRETHRAVDKNKGIVSKHSLYEKYGPKSKKGNYLTYARRARKAFDASKTIKNQVSDVRIYKSINQKISLNRDRLLKKSIRSRNL